MNPEKGRRSEENMKTTPLICAALSILITRAADRFNVVVCNMGNISATDISHAEADVAYVFQSIGLEIDWTDCGDLSHTTGSSHRFILRVRPHGTGASGGLIETMGMAYVTADAPHVYADVYMDGVQRFAESWNAPPKDVLGYAMAHELGHLLLGPRHAPTGLMSAQWTASDLYAMQHRALKFTVAERVSIRRELHGKAPGAALATRSK